MIQIRNCNIEISLYKWYLLEGLYEITLRYFIINIRIREREKEFIRWLKIHYRHLFESLTGLNIIVSLLQMGFAITVDSLESILIGSCFHYTLGMFIIFLKKERGKIWGILQLALICLKLMYWWKILLFRLFLQNFFHTSITLAVLDYFFYLSQKGSDFMFYSLHLIDFF